MPSGSVKSEANIALRVKDHGANYISLAPWVVLHTGLRGPAQESWDVCGSTEAERKSSAYGQGVVGALLGNEGSGPTGVLSLCHEAFLFLPVGVTTTL